MDLQEAQMMVNYPCQGFLCVESGCSYVDPNAAHKRQRLDLVTIFNQCAKEITQNKMKTKNQESQGMITELKNIRKPVIPVSDNLTSPDFTPMFF